MRKSILATSLVSMIAFVAFTASPVASAEEVLLNGTSKTVNFADLDLNKEAGAQMLYTRLEQAAKEVCHFKEIKSKPSCPSRAKQMAAAKRCYNKVMTEAVNKIDNENLTKLHKV